MTQDTERVELQVLLANLMRDIHYLQICDQHLATGRVDDGIQPSLRRVGVAAAMLDHGTRDLLESVTGVVPERPGQ